jgi:hypothetical protein
VLLVAVIGCTATTGDQDAVSEGSTTVDSAWGKPNPDDPNCFGGFCIDNIGEVRGADDVRRVLAALRSEAASNPGLHPVSCHFIAHEVGKQFGETGAGLDEIFALYDGSCTSGYLHGAIGVYARTNSIETQGQLYAEKCRTASSGSVIIKNDCLHGYGHAIAEKEHSTISSTLSGCDTLPVSDRGECAAGALMEVYVHQLADWEISTLCTNAPADYLDECYTALWAFARNSGTSLETFVSWCPVGVYAAACGNGIGNWLYTESGDIDAVLAACLEYRRGGVELVDGCVNGSVTYHISMETTDGTRLDEYVSACSSQYERYSTCREAETSYAAMYRNT